MKNKPVYVTERSHNLKKEKDNFDSLVNRCFFFFYSCS